MKQSLTSRRRGALFLLTLSLVFYTGVLADRAACQQTDLSAAQKETLQKVIGEYRASKRGPGIGVLFADTERGEEVAATQFLTKELGRDLYRVDTSKIISKYIGETEKNLRQVFASAQASHSILFFDEADALFGKRSEVKDSHDRYANQEIDYLLQQLEKFDGLVIISIKRKADIDQAFLRRLRFVLESKPHVKRT